ncbi:MAG: hypothetical protein WAN14_20380 [Candidatus Acidiferrales bacterium]
MAQQSDFVPGVRVVQINNPNGIRGTVVASPYRAGGWSQAQIPGISNPYPDSDMVFAIWDDGKWPTINPWQNLVIVEE